MSSPFHLEYFDPPAELDRHVLTTFAFATGAGAIADRHPGALGQLVIFPYGNGQVRFGDEVQAIAPGAYLFSGYSAAAPFEMQGPWHAVGASLSPLGWAALTGEPANKHIDRFIPAEEILGDAITAFQQSVVARYNTGGLTGEAACTELAAWVSPRLGRIASWHEKLIEATIGWLGESLNPELENLFKRIAYSRRQTERLVERYFGLPPAALARKFRAVRSAALLAKEELSDEAESEIACAFFDQSHMIREIRRFCGYTPSRLGGPQDLIFQTLLQLKNLDRLEEFRAIE